MLLIKDLVRFAGAGALNTGLTFVLFQMLVLFLDPEIAYSVTWIVGLVIVFLFYPEHVFKGGRTSTLSRILMIAVYIASYGIGLWVLMSLKALGIDPRLGIGATLIVTAGFSFLGSRLVSRW